MIRRRVEVEAAIAAQEAWQAAEGPSTVHAVRMRDLRAELAAAEAVEQLDLGGHEVGTRAAVERLRSEVIRKGYADTAAWRALLLLDERVAGQLFLARFPVQDRGVYVFGPGCSRPALGDGRA